MLILLYFYWGAGLYSYKRPCLLTGSDEFYQRCIFQHSSYSKSLIIYIRYLTPTTLPTVCEYSDVCPLHPSRLIAPLLLTHFKTDCTFLIYLSCCCCCFFRVQVSSSLSWIQFVCVGVRAVGVQSRWRSRDGMIIKCCVEMK